MLVSYTATLLRWKLQPAKILSVTQPLFRGCNFNLPKCWSVAQPLFRGGNYNLPKYISYTATLPRLSYQSAEMLVSCTATLPRLSFQSAEILSVTQPLFRGCHFNVLKCWSVTQPLFCTTPLSADWSPLQHTLSAAQSSPPPNCWPTGRPSNPTVSQLVTTPTSPVSHPISPTTPLSANWSPLQHPLSADLLLALILMWSAVSAGPLLMPIMSHPLPGQ